MYNDIQVEERKKRVKIVVEAFLSYDDITISQLSKIINVSSSTIQRDLNDVNYIQMVYGKTAKDILIKISEKLKINKKNGVVKGGVNSTTNNEPVRDENGKFTGNKKR